MPQKPSRQSLLIVFSLLGLLWISSPSQAQPTYKLDVKPNLKPLATLKLEGNQITRSTVKEDPGFRLQYHIKKNTTSVTTIAARGTPSVEIAQREAGTYTVVLELFYPNYKGGTAQKGEFKPISNILTYRIDPGANPSDPPKIVLIETPKPPEPTPPEKK